MTIICDVYKSLKHDEMYIYVPKQKGLVDVPEALMQRFGKHQLALSLLLTEDKKLARARAPEVLHSLDEIGYYLQMPPAKEAEPEDTVHWPD